MRTLNENMGFEVNVRGNYEEIYIECQRMLEYLKDSELECREEAVGEIIDIYKAVDNCISYKTNKVLQIKYRGNKTSYLNLDYVRNELKLLCYLVITEGYEGALMVIEKALQNEKTYSIFLSKCNSACDYVEKANIDMQKIKKSDIQRAYYALLIKVDPVYALTYDDESCIYEVTEIPCNIYILSGVIFMTWLILYNLFSCIIDTLL